MVIGRGLNFLKEFSIISAQRMKSEMDYFRFQEFQAKAVYEDINRILAIPKNSFVIDFGCGNGGYTNYLSGKYKKALGIDFKVNKAASGNCLYESHDLLEYRSLQKADLIFCTSVIEHIRDRHKFIKVIKDNLKKEGSLYLSFPPFYSPAGGHHLKPFHYLPMRACLWLAKKLKRIDKSVRSYEDLFGEWGLYKTSIKQIKELLLDNNFSIIEYKPRFSPVNTAKIPFLADLFTWHVEFYCKNGG